MTASNLQNTRHVVLVLGSGRSGTSLLMQILMGAGMQISNNVITANASNPEGFFEDADIRQAHVQLMDELTPHPSIPFAEDWQSTPAARSALQKIQEVVSTNINGSTGIWGVKDPLISVFLPIWHKVFNRLRIVPIYLLTIRNPNATVASYVRQYGYQGYLAELVWLIRMVKAIYYTAADCFIVHYEDWFSESSLIAHNLLRYTGLDHDFKGSFSDLLTHTVKLNLNRASLDSYEIKNPYIDKLYMALKECHGADFDRKCLMTVVKECHEAMDGFKGWYQLAHQANKKLADMQKRFEKVSAEAANQQTLKTKIQILEKEKIQDKQLATQLQKLQRQLNQLMAIKSV